MRNITALIIGLALVVTACGTAEPAATTEPTVAPTTTTTLAPPTPTTQGPVVAVLASFETKREMTSARIEGSLVIRGLVSEDTEIAEATLRFGSAFNGATGDSSFLMDMSDMLDTVEVDPDDPMAGAAAAFLGDTEFRTIGDRVYVKFGFVTALMGSETPWVSMPEEEGNEFTRDTGEVPQDPNEILDAYADANGTVEDLGIESVNGVEARHYRVLLDSDTMRLTAEERRELEESGLFAAGEIPMDLWITDDGYLVRIVLELDGSELESENGDEFQSMVLTYDVYDINGDVVIEPPPADQVTAIEDLDPFGFGEEG